MHKIFCFTLFISALLSCSNPVKTTENKEAGKLKATHQLVLSGEKKIPLDNETAPRSPYMQLLNDSSGARVLTLLNSHNNSIYFFDYDSSEYLRKVSYEREGADAIINLSAYYIKNMDSIYIYNRALVDVVLTDSTGHIKQRILLHGNETDWALHYPQYALNTVCPFIETSGKLILTGLNSFSIHDSLISKFHFTACIDMMNNQVEFHHTYPPAIYGNNANWEDLLFMQIYPALSPSGELIHSFPASHDLFLTSWNTDSSTMVYGGSNVAKTIHSIDWDWLSGRTPNELIASHYLQQDLYAAILYDPWRKIYYRFMQQGITDATTRTPIKNKPVIVILMDEQFNYLGETLIGVGEMWNWTNSFVTKEGLNIEFIDAGDSDEVYLNFKIFTLEKL